MKKREKTVSSLANAWFLVKRAYQLNPAGILVKIPSLLLSAAMKFLPLLLVREILNSIQTHRDLKFVLLRTTVYGASMLVCWLLREYFSYLEDRQSSNMSRIMRRDINQHVIHLPYEEVEAPQTRNLLHMLEDDLSITDLLDSFSNMVMQVIVLAGLIGIICTLQPFVLLLLALVLWTRSFVKGLTRKLWKKWCTVVNDKFRKVSYMLEVLREPSYGKEIRINGLQSWVSKKMDHASDEYIDTMSAYNRKIQQKNLIVELSLIAQELIVYLLLARKTLRNAMLIGDFSMYVSSISSFASAFSSLIDSSSEILKAGDFFAMYRDLIEKNPVEEAPSSFPMPKDITIRFDHVSFHYPSNEKLILDDICLELKTGKSLSIVGMNGAGKTTLVKLLCRFYKPTSGTITLNGTDIFKIPTETYQKVLGVVFQDYKLLAFSVAENVALSPEYDSERLNDALAKCGLADKVNQLPAKEQTSMSKILDDAGVEFSGGESQRIELCRVLYKDAPLVILDEPTASLDPKNEYELYQMMHTYTQDKCSVFISHRLASTRFTDEIAVISNGKIVEIGSFDTLVKLENGMFREMYEMQSAYYMR